MSIRQGVDFPRAKRKEYKEAFAQLCKEKCSFGVIHNIDGSSVLWWFKHDERPKEIVDIVLEQHKLTAPIRDVEDEELTI